MRRLAILGTAFTTLAVAVLAGVGAAAPAVGGEAITVRPQAVSIAVSPSTGLSDGATVSVTGTGFAPGVTVHLVQCPPSMVPGPCGKNPFAAVSDSSGAFTTKITVPRVLYFNFIPFDCAQFCLIEAYTQGPGVDASAGIEFDTNVPAPPSPSMGVDPATGLVDGQVVAVTGSHLPTDWPNGVGNIVECRTDSDRPSTCDLTHDLTTYHPDSSGTLSVQLTVHRSITTGSGVVDCTIAPGCIILLGNPDSVAGDGSSLRTPIQFAVAATAVAHAPAFTG